MVARILVPLEPSTYSSSALELATLLARQNDAELTGIAVLDTPSVQKHVRAVPLGGMYWADRLKTSLIERGIHDTHELVVNFKEKCEREGVAHRESERQGAAIAQILQESEFYDALIVGLRTHFRFGESESRGHSLAEIMDRCSTPIFGVPGHFHATDLRGEPMRVVIAFDGSCAATRALHYFCQLSPPDAYEVVLLNAASDRNRGQKLLEGAQALLEAHHFGTVRTILSERNIRHVFESDFSEWAAMVVVGAHSRSRVAEMLLGGFTRFLLREEQHIVLIAQ